MKRFLPLFFILFLLINFNFKGYATSYIIHKDQNTLEIPIEKYIYFYEDNNNTISIDSLLQNPKKYIFKQSNNKSLNFGFTNKTIWLKISIDNQTTLNKDFLFSIDYALLNEVSFYDIVDNKIVREIITGENYPFKSRVIKDNSYVFLLNNYPLQFKTYFVRINSNGDPLQIPMQINSPTHDKEVHSIELIGIAIY